MILVLVLAGLARGVVAQSGAAALAAPDTLRLSVTDAVRRAMAQSFGVRAARAAVRDADGQVRVAFAGALPQVTGSVLYTRQFASIYQGLGGSDTSSLVKLFQHTPFGAPNSWNVQLQATQLVWSGGKVGAGLAAAREFRQIARLNAAESAAEVAFRTQQAYWDAVLKGRLLAIAADNLEQARGHLRQVRLFRQAGTRAEYDLLRAEVDAANQEPPVVQARNNYELAVLDLKRLLDVPSTQPLVLETALDSPDGTVPVPATDPVAERAIDRPSLAAADALVSQQRQLLTVARADYWPTLQVTTTYTEQAFPQTVFPDATGQFRRGWNGEVKLSFPIFNGFKTAGAIEQARAAVERAETQRDSLRRQVELDVTAAAAEVARTQALLVARQGTVRQARRAHVLAGVRYTNGMATELEVADARVAAQQAATNEVQATRDYFVALAQLERALGHAVPLVRRPIEQLAETSNVKDAQP
ncbi:MAG TPA: TolC family protein [Gemmatimonadales bacterium]|nr:TolC family protein [Gemmatimonadales bacterium]